MGTVKETVVMETHLVVNRIKKLAQANKCEMIEVLDFQHKKGEDVVITLRIPNKEVVKENMEPVQAAIAKQPLFVLLGLAVSIFLLLNTFVG